MEGIFQGYRPSDDGTRATAAEIAAEREKRWAAERAASVAGQAPDAYTASGMACFCCGGQFMAADGSWPRERLISAIDGTEVNTGGAGGCDWLPCAPCSASKERDIQLAFELEDLVSDGYLRREIADLYLSGNKHCRKDISRAMQARDDAAAEKAKQQEEAAEKEAIRAANSPFAALAALKQRSAA